jgi:hypothetical protein
VRFLGAQRGDTVARMLAAKRYGVTAAQAGVEQHVQPNASLVPSGHRC